MAARHTPVTLSFLARGAGAGCDRLILEAATGDEAHAVEELPARLAGDDITVRFNPDFLLDGLAAVESDTVLLRFTGVGKPVLLSGKPSDPGEPPEFQYLVMPVRLPVPSG